jgi:prevent-host-death family protein
MGMAEIPLRELRNHASEVVRRVEESGEELDVTINGRPAVKIVPLPRRPRFLPAEYLLEHQADPGLRDELRELLGDETTDDIEDPWDRYGR